MSACNCAVHCVLNPYHERACCSQATCACWCHAKTAIQVREKDGQTNPHGPMDSQPEPLRDVVPGHDQSGPDSGLVHREDSRGVASSDLQALPEKEGQSSAPLTSKACLLHRAYDSGCFDCRSNLKAEQESLNAPAQTVLSPEFVLKHVVWWCKRVIEYRDVTPKIAQEIRELEQLASGPFTAPAVTDVEDWQNQALHLSAELGQLRKELQELCSDWEMTMDADEGEGSDFCKGSAAAGRAHIRDINEALKLASEVTRPDEKAGN